MWFAVCVHIRHANTCICIHGCVSSRSVVTHTHTKLDCTAKTVQNVLRFSLVASLCPVVCQSRARAQEEENTASKSTQCTRIFCSPQQQHVRSKAGRPINDNVAPVEKSAGYYRTYGFTLRASDSIRSTATAASAFASRFVNNRTARPSERERTHVKVPRRQNACA